MKLRPYQQAIQDAIFHQWKTVRSTLVVAPTGTGKTVVFATVIRRLFPKRVMILAHRQELIWQAREKIQRVTGLKVDVEMGEYKAEIDTNLFKTRSSVIVSTVQTHVAGGDGAGRIGKFNPMDFGCLIIDEAHHATSPSYRRIIDYYKTNPNLVVLGVTATPDRADEEALGQVFDSVAYDYEILDAIHDGWLVPIEQQFISTEIDFSGIRTVAGDLNLADLDVVMTAEKPLQGVVRATVEAMYGFNENYLTQFPVEKWPEKFLDIEPKKAILFTTSVNHASVSCNIFNRYTSGLAAFLCGKTDKEERKMIISDFAKGKIKIICNCGVLTEGFDDSGVEIISMGRPTKSRALYAQMIGRGTRPHESIAHQLNDVTNPFLRRSMILRSKKPTCLVIDFVGNSGKHKLITTADILGGRVSDEAVQSAINLARSSGGKVRMDKLVEEEEEKQKKMKEAREQAAARKAKLVAKVTYKKQIVNPFDAMQIKPIANQPSDDGKILSEKQRARLRSFGYDPDSMEYARASQLLGILIDRMQNKKCTLKQAGLLERCGWSKQEALDMGFEQASKSIDAAAKNGWRKPVEMELKPVLAGETDDIPY